MPVVMMTDVTGRLYGVLRWRPKSTLWAKFRQVARNHSIVPVYIEVVRLLHEGKALVLMIWYVTLPAFHLETPTVEPYVSIFVLH